MKLMSKLTALVIITSFIFVACEDEKEEEAVSASIHAKVMFMNYVAGSDATMIMAYLWEGSDWSTASAGGTVANAMFSVSVSDTLNTMSEAEFEDLPAGTYYMVVVFFRCVIIASGFQSRIVSIIHHSTRFKNTHVVCTGW